jgi:hypothetical protein
MQTEAPNGGGGWAALKSSHLLSVDGSDHHGNATTGEIPILIWLFGPKVSGATT